MLIRFRMDKEGDRKADNRAMDEEEVAVAVFFVAVVVVVVGCSGSGAKGAEEGGATMDLDDREEVEDREEVDEDDFEEVEDSLFFCELELGMGESRCRGR